MSKLVYAGNRAGMQKDGTRGGDANSPFDYELHCSCETLLGPLGRFTQNADGLRTALCPTCKHVTIIDKRGGIKVVPFSNLKVG